jgi:hypothetical protein
MLAERELAVARQCMQNENMEPLAKNQSPIRHFAQKQPGLCECSYAGQFWIAVSVPFSK